jgi:uncharacterized protein YndB with AHSA1/START domain
LHVTGGGDAGRSGDSHGARVRRTRRAVVETSPAWTTALDLQELERWFANDVELDLRPGGEATFRWSNGESRHATVTEIEPGERLSLEWDDEGEVEFSLADDLEGTRLTVVETSPAWTTALDLQASALAYA